MATLYLFAGPNGSGKSTIITNYIEYYGLEDVEYVCPDIYASGIFAEVYDVQDRYVQAMQFAEYKRERLLVENKSMIIETVLSRSDKLDFVKKAKGLGYRVISIFVGTESAEINCQRVKQRVLEGGHDVPVEKIYSRYFRAMENLTVLAECSDELYVYDNTKSCPVLGLSIIDKNVYSSAESPDWIKKLFKEQF